MTPDAEDIGKAQRADLARRAGYCTTHHICDCKAYALYQAENRCGTYEHRIRGAEAEAEKLRAELLRAVGALEQIRNHTACPDSRELARERLASLGVKP